MEKWLRRICVEAIDNFIDQKTGGFLRWLFKMHKKLMTGAPLIINFRTIDPLPQRKSKAPVPWTLIIRGSGALHKDAVESRCWIGAGELR